MAQKKSVLVYGLSTCPYCRRAKEFIENHNIAYDLIYVDKLADKDKAAAVEAVRELNPRLSFPTIKIYDDSGFDVYVGLDESAEKALLALV